MTTELTTTAVADSKKSDPKIKQLILWIAALAVLSGMIALANYNLAHHPELWNAITVSTT
jgi:hypothetical protein